MVLESGDAKIMIRLVLGSLPDKLRVLKEDDVVPFMKNGQRDYKSRA